MLIEQIKASTVRIFTNNTRIVGVGFLVDAHNIITCAHVIADALGIPRDTEEKPNSLVSIDFPLLSTKEKFSAKIVVWNSNEDDDIAGLELNSLVIESARPARLVIASNLGGHAIRVFGFPSDALDLGAWASGHAVNPVANGWIEIGDTKQTGYFVQPGFSGGAVWDEELEGVVGVVVAAGKNFDRRVGYMQPTQKLIELWPTLVNSISIPGENDLLETQIKEMIVSGWFKEAYESCRKVLAKDPSRPLTNLLAAISVLHGQIIDKLSQNAIQRAEEHIAKVPKNSHLFPTAMAMLGAIKYDYYVANGLDEKRPSVEEIADVLQKSSYQSIDFDLLNFIKPSNTSMRKLGVKK